MGGRYSVFGAGRMAEAIVQDLLNSKNTDHVWILDSAYGKEATPASPKAVDLAEKFNDERVHGRMADVSDYNEYSGFLQDSDVAISAVPYEFNKYLTMAAIEKGTHFCDLGGNNSVVEEQFKLNKEAKKNGVKIVPDCGIAPGAVSIITALGIEKLHEMGLKGYPDSVKIRVGGLPQEPKGPLNYQLAFSVHGLINEYIEDAEILRDGKIELVESMTGLEKMLFYGFCGREVVSMEAAFTSGGSSTLTKTFKGKIRELDYKTIRYPGHWEKMKFLKDMGFFREGFRQAVGDVGFPRQWTEKVLENELSYNGKDALLCRVELLKADRGRATKLTYRLADYFDEETGMSAMQRTTGYSISIIAQMLADNKIEDTGVLCHEKSVPPKLFVKEWERRGIKLKENIVTDDLKLFVDNLLH